MSPLQFALEKRTSKSIFCCCNKMHRTMYFIKKRNLFSSLFGRLWVQNRVDLSTCFGLLHSGRSVMVKVWEKGTGSHGRREEAREGFGFEGGFLSSWQLWWELSRLLQELYRSLRRMSATQSTRLLPGPTTWMDLSPRHHHNGEQGSRTCTEGRATFISPCE